MRTFHVYILSSSPRELYIGVTNDIVGRLAAHRDGSVTSTSRFGVVRLVYLESTNDVRAAIAREKQLKGWVRRKKIALIQSMNPAWDDLAEVWALLPRLSS